jgi:hypothetical protein
MRRWIFVMIESVLGAVIFFVLMAGLWIIYDFHEETSDLESPPSREREDWEWQPQRVRVLKGPYAEGPSGYDWEYLNINGSPGLYRIVIFGDSVTYGGCPDVIALERMLNKKLGRFFHNKKAYKGVNVVNAGRGGMAIDHSLDRLKLLTQNNVEIDKAYLLTGWNEHWYNAYSNPCMNSGCVITGYGWLLEKSRSSSRLVRDMATPAAIMVGNLSYVSCMVGYNETTLPYVVSLNHTDTSIYRVPMELYERYMSEFNNKTRDLTLVIPPDGLTPGVVPIMSMRDCTLMDPGTYNEVHELYIKKQEEFAQIEGLRVLDLQEGFKSADGYKELLFGNADIDPIHPNPAGNDYCTQLYFEDIIREIG